MAEETGKLAKFIWKVENYSYCWNKLNDFLQSPEFKMDVFEGGSWCLKLYPRGITSYEKYVSVRLKRLESSEGPLGITVDYEIALLRPDGTAEYVKETKNRSFRKGYAFGFDNLASQEEILGSKRSTLLQEDILTVQCCLFQKGIVLKRCKEITAKTHIELERSVFVWGLISSFSNRQYESNRLHVFNKKRYIDLKILWPDNNIVFRFFDHFTILKIIRCKIGILDSNDSVSWLIDKQIDHSDTVDVTLTTVNEVLKQKSLYLSSDKLTLYCDITFSFGSLQSKIEMVAYNNALAYVTDSRKISSDMDVSPKNYSCYCTDTDASFKSDFHSLYQEGSLCDFKLKVGNENIQAHKVVLGARSPVFKAMLTSNMKENEKNMVDITDLDANTVRRMLTFMYTDTTGDLDWEAASKLYFAADKYGILKLKRICSSVLERNLCVSNVGEALSLANLHRDDDLKNLTLEFITIHDTEVMCSTEWKNFMTEEVHLAADTMRYIFMKKAEKNTGKN